MSQNLRWKTGLAMVIRVLSVPPVMVSGLVLVLAVSLPSFFGRWQEAAAMLFFLAILPLAAYPCSWLIPRIRAKGREGQRNLAFVLSGIGYVCGWLYGLLWSKNREQILIYSIYLFSVIGLLICNKLLHLRASGHGCSVTGPLAVMCYYLGLGGIVPGVIAYAAIFWASVKTKRHTVGQFLGGSVICIAAGALSWLCCTYLPLFRP